MIDLTVDYDDNEEYDGDNDDGDNDDDDNDDDDDADKDDNDDDLDNVSTQGMSFNFRTITKIKEKCIYLISNLIFQRRLGTSCG